MWDGDVWAPNPEEEHWFDRARRVMARHGWKMSYDTAEVPDGYAIYSGPAVRGLLHSTIGLNGGVSSTIRTRRALD